MSICLELCVLFAQNGISSGMACQEGQPQPQRWVSCGGASTKCQGHSPRSDRVSVCENEAIISSISVPSFGKHEGAFSMDISPRAFVLPLSGKSQAGKNRLLSQLMLNGRPCKVLEWQFLRYTDFALWFLGLVFQKNHFFLSLFAHNQFHQCVLVEVFDFVVHGRIAFELLGC